MSIYRKLQYINIITLSEFVAIRRVPKIPQAHAAIQITTHDGQWPELRSPLLLDVLQLHFWDLAKPLETLDIEEEDLFTKRQARLIFDFILEVNDLVRLLVIHCEAGVSRSVGVANALRMIKYDEQQKMDNFLPNGTTRDFITQVMLETYFNEYQEIS